MPRSSKTPTVFVAEFAMSVPHYSQLCKAGASKLKGGPVDREQTQSASELRLKVNSHYGEGFSCTELSTVGLTWLWLAQHYRKCFSEAQCTQYSSKCIGSLNLVITFTVFTCNVDLGQNEGQSLL